MLPKTPQVRWVVVLVCVLAAVPALAQSLGTAFTYQGRLTDGGSPATGAYDLQLVLFDTAVGGAQVGPILARDDVTVTNGLFTVSLDFGGVFAGSKRWLEIGVRPGASTGGYSTLSPRQELAPSPNAVFSASAPWAGITAKPAGFADGIDNDVLGGLNCASGQIAKWNGASWDCAADADTIGWGLTGNAGTNPATNFIGTTDNQALVLRVNGIQALRLEPNATSPNVVGGFSGNSATALFGAAIGGGGIASSPNSVTNIFGTVAGGKGNVASGFATVGGGQLNTASGEEATVGGGHGNWATRTYATAGGGVSNIAAGDAATVGGGVSNVAAGYAATVGGGVSNVAAGYAATVGGGDSNAASGARATVGGGYQSQAGGDISFAAGRRAKVRDATQSGDIDGDEGAFIWADYQDADFTSTGPNQFLIRAAGGVGINTNAPAGNALAVSGNAAVTGNVGIGTSDPHTKLHVTGGSVYIAAPNSLILTSPNGNCWFITVDDAGGLGSFQIPCP